IDKKKKKEETKVPVRDMKEKGGEEEKKDKPKAHAPSHAKIRSIGEKPNALAEPRGEEESLTKKGKKKKTVHWAEEEQLKHYFYFDLDETERVNVNKIKDFGEAAKRELMMDRQTFEMARRLSHDTMEERVPWTPPRPLTLAGCLVTSGANSTEKLTQRDREMGILQEIFLSKESVPDSPHEPDPEPYEPMPPRLIPLDEDSSMQDDGYVEPMDTTSQPGSGESAKLPPVLANLIGNLNNSSRSPQASNIVSNTVPPSVNIQELLSSIMGPSGNQSTEELIKQPDFSDKIKQLLGSLQQTQNQNQNQTISSTFAAKYIPKSGKRVPQTLSRGWGDQLIWAQTYEEGLYWSRSKNKPLLVIFHLEDCPHSQ
ncbi:serine/threonine-protein phosphatase 1 regulatory subunit 10-like, partial [Neolamprologus brichardi]|uniref:serine/threonine-protein phosphatase 1 regulatory subunit 10-like n=1 Tax=Neolamprologus brichardi TaxID=32507 RepID=UPI001643C959